MSWGLVTILSQHAAYVGSWIKALKNDPMEIFRAAADAERIQNYVLGLEQKQVQEQAAQQAQNQTQSENRLATEDVMTPNIGRCYRRTHYRSC